jgi:hypothetical protein
MQTMDAISRVDANNGCYQSRVVVLHVRDGQPGQRAFFVNNVSNGDDRGKRNEAVKL